LQNQPDVEGDPSRVCDLVLEGGGVKGAALIGVAVALEEAGYRFNRLAGTSVGALVAALLGSGMPARRAADLVISLDFQRLLDPTRVEAAHLGWLGRALSDAIDLGLYQGDALRDAAEEALGELGVRTFSELRLVDPGADPNLPADHRYRVVMVTSDITRELMVRVPWDLRRRYGIEPDSFPVAVAVQMSTAVPFFYTPVRLRSELTGQESLMVDGGLTSGFPLHIFERTDGKPPRWPTFQVGLVSTPPATHPVAEISSRPAFLRGVVHTALHGRLNAERDEPKMASRTITVDTSYVASTDLSIGRETRRRLFDDGHEAGVRFLESLNA